MRLTLRLVWILAVGLTCISLLFTWRQIQRERRTFQRDLERRAEAVGESLAGVLEPLMDRRSPSRIRKVVQRFGDSQHLAGVAVYDGNSVIAAAVPGVDRAKAEEMFATPPAALLQAISGNNPAGQIVRSGKSSTYVYALPLHDDQAVIGGVVLTQDASYIEIRTTRLWREAALRIFIQSAVVLAITILIMRRNILRPMARTAQWMKAIRTGKGSDAAAAAVPSGELFEPFAQEVTSFAESLSAARASAEQEARLRNAADWAWTSERLAVHVKAKLNNSSLLVVSNREPYMHRRRGKKIESLVPASGLVTALEPILNACDGTWVAHGSGDADREVVDSRDRVRVPPDGPRYTLRRVWLSKQEEEGYYYGFSNEGLWPLCHIAHTRPIFRAGDWEQYREVNRKFADTVLEEIAGTREPAVLVQDYHFALLPQLIKEQRPDARVAIFWHIPWPNPEAFGICPWQAELLDGLLAADLIGFHIQTHCHNFLETVDRGLECRIDWPSCTANRNGHRTEVRPFPISVDIDNQRQGFQQGDRDYVVAQAQLLKELGVEALYLGVGVDRVDYTKGIPERFAGIERLLEKHPSYVGKLAFVQIGAPSRMHIKRYYDVMKEVEAEAERINWKFKAGNWRPIVLLNRHHDHTEIARYYKLADFCLVTSLHDGMNLVAKEFVAARADEQGVLILSRFAGAAHELNDALIVNPYHADEIAEAIRTAVEMPDRERRLRMRRMRQVVKEQNIYRWAGTLIGQLSELRPDLRHKPASSVSSRALTAANGG